MAGIQITYSDASEFNRYPHYLYEYFYRMARPPLTASLVIAMYFVRHRVLRQTVFRELHDFWQAWFFTDKRAYRLNV
jgi:hypothetical protein